ncbi:hypothetical protein PAXRUDRAFT_831493, partial [Paxillus rubicundulus Ve08.2h10]
MMKDVVRRSCVVSRKTISSGSLPTSTSCLEVLQLQAASLDPVSMRGLDLSLCRYAWISCKPKLAIGRSTEYRLCIGGDSHSA